MSNICGLFCFRNDQISSKNAIRIEFSSLSKSKEQDLEIWTDRNIGLARQKEISVTDLSSIYDAKNQFSIVADACLTNRTELLNEFGVFPSEQLKFRTDQLILRAYEKWGDDCVEHLLGDFAFALWDKQSQRLFCARDHMGGSRLFYHKNNKRFIFGSTPQVILNFTGVEEKFNKRKLAYYLSPEPHTIAIEESWFENIFPLPPGTILIVDHDGIKTRKYWQPEIGESLPYKNKTEILEAFREIMFEIVDAPLKEFDSVTCLLSGGLDSSGIVSVAAKLLEKRNKELTVFSHVLENKDDPVYSDERFFIDQFKSFPNVNIKYISASGDGPFTQLKDFFENYDSPVATSRHYLYRKFTEEARKSGSHTILEGGFGECGPTYSGESGFAELLGNFKWLTLWRELKKRKTLYGHSIKYNFRANALNPFLPNFVKKMKRNNLNDEVHQNSHHPLQEHLSEELFKTIDFQQCLVGTLYSDHRKGHLNDIDFLYRKITDFPSNTFGSEPVQFRYPFLNKKLLEFCLAVPLELKIHNGYNRYLIRAGLDEILPPKVQWRTSKTPFSPDYIRRYSAQIGQVQKLLAEIGHSDPIREILDIEKIKGWISLSARNTGDSTTSYKEFIFDLIPQAIYLIYFLRRFSEFREVG